MSAKQNKREERAQDRGIEPSKKELEKGKADWLRRIPPWFKAVFLKFWFAGAVFFFLGMGLFIFSLDQLDLILALGLTLGVVSDLMINRILKACDTEGEHMKHVLLYDKKFRFVFFNLIYGIVVAFAISYTYTWINQLIILIGGLSSDAVPLPAEPLLYGAFFVLYDFVLLSMKRLIMFIIRKVKSRGHVELPKGEEEQDV